MYKYVIFLSATLFSFSLTAQDIRNNPGSNHGNRFEQLGTILPTPNEYRTASGAPGPNYWQQRADYDIVCELDEPNRILYGKETITYYNNSKDELRYLWLQLDENQHSTTNNAGYLQGNSMPQSLTPFELERLEDKKDREYGHNITGVTDSKGNNLPYFINKTMMRVDLLAPLKPGARFTFKVDWHYNIINRRAYGGRGGYEYFPGDGNDLFTITQWFPRLCVYSDNEGWQNHQFTGRGEFTLVFGNYKVSITVPEEHIVMATGECQNYNKVLTAAQMQRWKAAQTATDVIEIVTLAEAVQNEKQKSTGKKTWVFKANMVRDFAWGSSRKFVWDAMPVFIDGKKVMCMSAYGKEAYPLYRRYSTKVTAHTIKTYSHFTIPYPYPVAQSIEASNGMEYPMICFNFGRAEADGTYTESTKNGMIGVIIHEVGHNFFPMIINSDERQWSWMDEGLNTFVQYLTEATWDSAFPVRRGPAYLLVDYMRLPKDQLEPIMTNSENIIHFGPNAYHKPATALNILRETIMGRELFDYSFREYARRWAFKHPAPADFFRTMEDASGEDLDWFWRAWFYNTDPCDISIDTVKWASLSTTEPTSREARERTSSISKPLVHTFEDISKKRNREDANIHYATDLDTSLQDFYWKYARGMVAVDTTPHRYIQPAVSDTFTTAEKMAIAGNKHLYEVTFSNKGGMVMPLIVEWTFEDGTKEIDRISAQIWRKNEQKVSRVFVKNKKAASIQLDPMLETTDIDVSNNYWPRVEIPGKFRLFKNRGSGTEQPNPMQRQLK